MKTLKAFLAIFFIIFMQSGYLISQTANIVVTPDSLSESLYAGETSTKTLTITNNESKDLAFNIHTDFSTEGSSYNYAIEFDGLDDYVSIQNAP